MDASLTVVCALFRSPRRNLGWGGWGIYDESWVDKLHRGFSRNLTEPFRMLCVTDFPNPEFETAGVETVPFIYPDHVGTWMSLNEVLRPDLEIDRGIFCGLDTIIMSPMDDIAAYDGNVAMTRDATKAARVSNAMVVFDGPSMVHLWELYMEDPEGWERRSVVEWSRGQGSEMVFWRENCTHFIDILDDLYPDRFYDFACARGKIPESASVVYFHGVNKPSTLRQHYPKIYEVWNRP